MGKRVTLVPRDESAAPDAKRVNTYLEGRDDVQRLDADAFVVEISSADVATQAEVTTGHDGEPIHYVRIDLESGGIPYGAPLATEVRKLCEELASRFDLVVAHGKDKKGVATFFEEGLF
jgi:hypothetical protein